VGLKIRLSFRKERKFFNVTIVIMDYFLKMSPIKGIEKDVDK
jgi:hypothetical protein